jgi:hypothetical protein
VTTQKSEVVLYTAAEALNPAQCDRIYNVIFFPWHNSPQWARDSSLSRLHTQIRHTRYDSPRRVIGPSQRPLPDNTQNSQEKDIHPSAGFEPAIPTSEQPQTHALDRAATGIGKVFSLPNIIRDIKSRRMRWFRHVVRMAEKKNTSRDLVRKSEGGRSL